jgi:hypothetical protein
MEIQDTLSKPKRGVNRILKLVIVAVIVLVVGLAALYVINTKIEWHPALKLTISTGVNETDGFPIVTNVTFEQTKVIYKGTDDKVVFPDIDVMARNGSVLAPPASYWASVQRDPKERNGTYTMTLTFRESYTPQKGDQLILTIFLTGSGGTILTKKTALYEWN